jgi:hypothetical protein
MHTLVPSFLDPEDVKNVSLGPSGTLAKEQGSDIRLWDTKGLSKGLRASGPKMLEPNYYSLLITQ